MMDPEFWEFALYGLFILSLIVAFVAQIRVSTTFRRYSRQQTAAGFTAAQVARMILDSRGLTYVRIERVRGHLTDHFDPRSRTLRLSDAVCDSTSPAAIGVAAHEVGHAIQHAEHYAPITVRSRLAPVTSFASYASWIMIVLGLILVALGTIGNTFLLIGIGLFSVTVLFELVTLPCEFNASNRAMAILVRSGYYTSYELHASRKVLSAAAMTYVAALMTSIIQLLRLLLIFRRNSR